MGEKEEVSLVEELMHITLDRGRPDRFVSIGSLLDPGLQGELTHFLRQNEDVFAWSHEDMPGIDPQIISHRLNVDPSFCLVKQKRRGMAPERQEAVHEEVRKLLKSQSVREVQYSNWLANILLVRNSNNK